jgi:hypothetical protein
MVLLERKASKKIFNVVQVLVIYDSETPTLNTPFLDHCLPGSEIFLGQGEINY